MAERPKDGQLVVEVACALPDRQRLETLAVAPGTTARRAVVDAGIGVAFPEIDVARCPLGVWGRPVADDAVLREGDRVEVYRPLDCDPREARRRLAAADARRAGVPLNRRA